jgi:membrane fusion protein, heavy metal efflux system
MLFPRTHACVIACVVLRYLIAACLVVLFGACSDGKSPSAVAEGPGKATPQFVRGPHRGRLLEDGSFAIELAIFESGVPPEFHAWPTLDGKPVPLDQVRLTVELDRLGDRRDRFAFTPQADYLRGAGVVREPHSFEVKVAAEHAGKTHQWSFESFEGRTRIAEDIAAAAGIKTETAGPATLVETLTLYGQIAPDPARQREVSARFPGIIQQVNKKLGDRVAAGEALAVIESNESLRTYSVQAPISGVIAARNANPGEDSGNRSLFTIIDPAAVTAELSLFPADRARVRVGAPVAVKATHSQAEVHGKLDRIALQAASNQAVLARVTLANTNGDLLPGGFVTARVQVAERHVPLAVKATGLQPFRDFTVVFEKVGDTYEVRMLELGETQSGWAEVLGGLEPGAQYVAENSYLVKADVEKSGASHDH